MAAHRHLRVSSDRLAVAMERLSSGLRINTAADDAAGLGISERLRGQIRSIEQANRNIQDGISLLQTAEAVLDTVHSILHRARELGVQYNNGTNDTRTRLTILTEMVQLSHEIHRIEQTAEFNGVPLLQSNSEEITLQVGANDGETITFRMADLFGMSTALVHPNTFFIAPFAPSNLDILDGHISDVATARARFGALVNRLEHTLSANLAKQEGYMAAESRIRDADMAMEATTLARQQLLQQSGTAMLANAQRGLSARSILGPLLQ